MTLKSDNALISRDLQDAMEIARETAASLHAACEEARVWLRRSSRGMTAGEMLRYAREIEGLDPGGSTNEQTSTDAP